MRLKMLSAKCRSFCSSSSSPWKIQIISYGHRYNFPKSCARIDINYYAKVQSFSFGFIEKKIVYVDIRYYIILSFKTHCCIKYHGGLVAARLPCFFLLIDPYRLILSSYPSHTSILVCWTGKLYTSVLQLSHPYMHWQNNHAGQSDRTAYHMKGALHFVSLSSVVFMLSVYGGFTKHRWCKHGIFHLRR